MSENEEINDTTNEERYDENYPDEQVQIESDENNADIIPDESVQNETEDSDKCSSCECSETIIDHAGTESESDSSDEIADNSADESVESIPSEESATPEVSPFESLNSHIDMVFNELNEKFDALNKKFSDRIARSETEAKIIQKMDSELKTYKDDLYRSLLRPIILELIDLRESILKISVFYLKKPEGEQAIPNATFAGYAEDISIILEKYDVEIIKSNSGDECLPLKHKILKAVPTDNESLHKKIAESFSSGYIYNGRVISPELVYVYKFEESAVPAEKVTDSNTSENAGVSENTENIEKTEENANSENPVPEQNSEEKKNQ